MKIKKITACLLCFCFMLGLVGGISVNATSACEVSSMLAVYNTQTETVNCTVKYSGTFIPNQSYVFILNNANGTQISMRTVNGTQLGVANNSFSYSFPVDTSLVTSAAKPLRVTVRSTQSYIISPYTVDVVIIDKNPTVSFVGKDGTVLKTQTVDYGTAAAAPDAPLVAGYEFVKWDKDFSAVTSDMTVNAVYTASQYTLNVVDGTGSGVHSYGSVVDIEFIPAPGTNCEFEGWTVEGNAVIADSTAQSTTVTVYGNATVKANYTELYTVTITGGKIAESDVKEYYKAGDVIEIIADSVTGKEFTGWEVEVGGTVADASASTTALTVNSNVIIKTTYTDSQYTLNVVGGDGSGTYSYGEKVTIRFATEGGAYIFDGWTVEGNAVIADPTAQITTVTVYGDATVRGSFTQLYSVDVINGTVHPDDRQDYYQSGAVIRVVADAPEAGMRFDTWAIVEGIGEITDASAVSTTITVGGMNLVVRAEYAENLEETSSEAESSDESSEGDEIYACTVKDVTVVYNNAAQTLTYRIEYTGTFIPNQAYMFVLSNGNGGIISAPTVMGTELSVDGNTVSYSYHLSENALSGAATPITGTIRCGVPQIISSCTAELSYAIGDVTNDGETDNLDAAYILRYDAELTGLDVYQLAVGDVNGDGEVDSLDASQVLKHDAGLVKLF
ncbi:MAG: hypothetical protein E7597_01155 [Ruminococcaceae bacterium]|nr:hypothetical protein [Oscillospiraceae bacterium]